MKVHDIVIITTQGAVIEYTVQAHGADFEERLSEALEEGSVLLDTAEGTKVIINPFSAVAVEISAMRECEKNIIT